MYILLFFLWIIIFSINLGIIDALNISKLNIKAPKLYKKKIKFYECFKTLLIFSLIILNIISPILLTQILIIICAAPFLYYFSYDSAYYFTRSKNDVPSWSWTTNAPSIYISRCSISFKTRFKLFLVGLLLFSTAFIIPQ